MPLSPDDRAKLLANTREAAAAFVEYMEYFRQLDEQHNVRRGEIRRLSVTLRRLLVDGELTAIASPRIGRVFIRAPDNNPAYRLAKREPIWFYASGRGNVFKGNVILNHMRALPFPTDFLSKMPQDWGDLKFVDLRVDSFLTQRVLCFYSHWISRREIIKYVANVASGAHTNAPRSNDELLLASVRRFVRYKVQNGHIQIEFFHPDMKSKETVFHHTADTLDPVLVEIIACTRFLSISPDIEKLENAIRAE